MRRRRRRTDADDEPIWGIQNTARALTTIIVIAYRESRRTNDMIHQTRDSPCRLRGDFFPRIRYDFLGIKK